MTDNIENVFELNRATGDAFLGGSVELLPSELLRQPPVPPGPLAFADLPNSR